MFSQLQYLILFAIIIPKSMAEFSVVLDNFGPPVRLDPPVETTPIRGRPIELSPVYLPYFVPQPRTIRNRCRCVKVIRRPQQVLQLIRIPVIRKYLQTITRPVVQVVAHERRP